MTNNSKFLWMTTFIYISSPASKWTGVVVLQALSRGRRVLLATLLDPVISVMKSTGGRFGWSMRLPDKTSKQQEQSYNIVAPIAFLANLYNRFYI